MLDPVLRRSAAPVIKPLAAKFSQAGFTTLKATAIALATGLLACLSVSFGQYIAALALLIVARIIAATASSLSEETRRTKIIATLADFTLFSAFVFCFLMGTGAAHGLGATLVIFSFMVMALAYIAHLALDDNAQETNGFVGQTEMLVFLGLCCLYPPGFSAFAAFFALLCFATAIMRTSKIIRNS